MTDFSPSPAAAPRGLRKAGIAIGAVALVVVLAGSAVRFHAAADARNVAASQGTPAVHLLQPQPLGASQQLVEPGAIAAWTDARLFARVPGYVHGWYADIGQRVAAGAPLGRIDTPELDEQINEARAALVRARAEAALARTTSARWQDLLVSHSVSRQEADEKAADAATHAAGVAEAEAHLGRLTAMKAFATLRAPFAGVITLRNADVGDLVGPGATGQQPMFALADDHRLRIYVNVPQQFTPLMHAGLTARLTVPAWPGRSFAARVLDQSGAIDGQTGALKVELVADNPDGALRPGGFVQVGFDLPMPAGHLSVPVSALIQRGGGTRVATVDGAGHAHLLPVTIGRDFGSTVEVVAGLGAGTPVVDSPPDSLAEGEAVDVVAKGGAHG